MSNTNMPALPQSAVRSLTNDPAEWIFPIQKTASWMNDFVNNFDSIDIRIWDDSEDQVGQYVATSSHLNGMSGPEAAARMKSLLTVLNGVLRIRRGITFLNLELGNGYRRDTTAQAQYGLVMPAVSIFPANVNKIRYSKQSNFKLSDDGRRVFMCRSDPWLLPIFEVLGEEGFSFVSLYKVLDTITGSLKADNKPYQKKDIAAIGNVTKSDLDNFTYTANNYHVAGTSSRHGKQAASSISIQSKVLSITEAVDTVMLPIIRNFVTQRIGATFPQAWQAVLI